MDQESARGTTPTPVEAALLEAIRAEGRAQARYLDTAPGQIPGQDPVAWLDATGQRYFQARLDTNKAFAAARFAAYEEAVARHA